MAKTNYSKVMKASGPGSRGGTVVGYTGSGKPIYANANHPEHDSFSRQDHADARFVHGQVALGYANRMRQAAMSGGEIDDMERARDHHYKQQSEHFLRGGGFGSPERRHHPETKVAKAGKGEGSRGGRVIGHTRSGKPVYDRWGHGYTKAKTGMMSGGDRNDFAASHRGWSGDDHLDAALTHENLAGRYEHPDLYDKQDDVVLTPDAGKRAGQSHRNIANVHYANAEWLLREEGKLGKDIDEYMATNY